MDLKKKLLLLYISIIVWYVYDDGTTGVGYCMGSMSIAGLRYDLTGQFMATESTDLTHFMVVWDIEINPEWPNNSGL